LDISQKLGILLEENRTLKELALISHASNPHLNVKPQKNGALFSTLSPPLQAKKEDLLAMNANDIDKNYTFYL